MNTILLNGFQAKQRIRKLIDYNDRKLHAEIMAATTINVNCFQIDSSKIDNSIKLMKLLIKCSTKIDEIINEAEFVKQNSLWMDKIFKLNKEMNDINEILENIDLPLLNDHENEFFLNFRNHLFDKLQINRKQFILSFVKFLSQMMNEKFQFNIVEYINNVINEKIEPNLEFIVKIWNQIIDENIEEDENIDLEPRKETDNDDEVKMETYSHTSKTFGTSNPPKNPSPVMMSVDEDETGFSLDFSFENENDDDDFFF